MGLRIGIDANGGDWKENRHPFYDIGQALPRLAEDFRRCCRDVTFVLFGDQGVIEDDLSKRNIDGSLVDVVDCPAYFVSKRKIAGARTRQTKEKVAETSLVNLLEQLSLEEIDCAFSMGETSSFMMYSKNRLGIIHGMQIGYPVLVAEIPKSIDGSFLLADVGANVSPSLEEMHNIVLMCSSYCRHAMNIPMPKVGLVSIGTENGKGNRLVTDLDRMLAGPENSELFAYKGLVEGKHGVFVDDTDIAVTDGFTGNVALKFAEGAVEAIKNRLKYDIARLRKGTYKERAGLAVIYLVHKLFLKDSEKLYGEKGTFGHFNVDRYNGAPILGLNNYIAKGHGNSTPDGIYHGIIRTIKYHDSKTIHYLRNILR